MWSPGRWCEVHIMQMSSANALPPHAETILEVRRQSPKCRIEVLIPDFKGNPGPLQKVLAASPDILNHNTETVPRLYGSVRPQGNYQWSLDVLRIAKSEGMKTKTGLMLGLGETSSEVLEVMSKLASLKVDILTLGQYLQPSRKHLPVERFLSPDEFSAFKSTGLAIGFKHVESGPLVRSSYHADEQC